MDYIKRAQEVFDVEIEGLLKVRRDLDASFAEAVRLMLDCLCRGRKIVVTGIGKSLHIAEKISATLASTGATSVVLNPSQAMHGDLGILCDGDVLLALSYSGESDELLALIPLARRLHLTVIAVTGSRQSTLAGISDSVIPVAVKREACPFNMAPTTSTTATLAMGDALAMVLLDARGIRKEDYAQLHPAGAIGRSLLLRVADIMRTADRLARVPQGASVKDALMAMTRARSGAVGIVDDQNQAVGIFTDGDLRRHIGERNGLLELPIADVMTTSPISVRPHQLAVDVLRIFEEHRIDDLLVVDEGGLLVGQVDIQDLPRLKIL